jgi:hypothetical protein
MRLRRKKVFKRVKKEYKGKDPAKKSKERNLGLKKRPPLLPPAL